MLSQSDTVTCLETKKLDFFITEYIRAKHLEQDTLLMNKEIKALNGVIIQKTMQVEDLDQEIILADTIISISKRNYDKLAIQNAKEQRKVMRLRNVSVIFGSISILLCAILVLVVK